MQLSIVITCHSQPASRRSRAATSAETGCCLGNAGSSRACIATRHATLFLAGNLGRVRMRMLNDERFEYLYSARCHHVTYKERKRKRHARLLLSPSALSPTPVTSSVTPTTAPSSAASSCSRVVVSLPRVFAVVSQTLALAQGMHKRGMNVRGYRHA